MLSFWKLSFPSPGYSQTFSPAGLRHLWAYVGGIADTPDRETQQKPTDTAD